MQPNLLDEAPDLVIDGTTIITMNPERQIINNGEITIKDGKIKTVQNYSTPQRFFSSNTKKIDAKNKIILPGLINTHTHLFQTLLRGIGQDLPVWEWFESAIDPTVENLTPEDAYISAKLGTIEAIKAGTTTILDFNYPHPHPGMDEEIIRAFGEVGIRGILARGIIDTGHVHSKIIHKTKDELLATENLISNYHGYRQGMISVWVAPYTIFSTSKEAFIQSKALADQYDTWLTMHAATPSSIEASMDLYNVEDIIFEDQIGFLGPNVLAVHCCGELSDDVLRIIKERDVKISHNPVSNAYLGEGIAPISKMIGLGIKVSLATDGPASNNNQDMVSVMKFAALLQKVSALNSSEISATKVLEMATIEGAECVGMDKSIGSIEVGKQADLIIFDPWKSNTIAFHDPIASLVYSATPENIHSVIINGEIVMDNREIVTVDEVDTMVKASKSAKTLLERAQLW